MANAGWFWGGKGTGHARTVAPLATSSHKTIHFATNFGQVAKNFKGVKAGGGAEQVNRAAAERASLAAAHLMVERLRRGIKRKGVSTRRLENAILDQGNRFASVDEIGVGIPSFLDSSNAPYWRAIEQGSSFFVGKRLTGVWSASPKGGPFSAFGKSTGGRFINLPVAKARQVLARQRGAAEGGVQGAYQATGAVSGVIRRPIVAKHYMALGWKDFDAQAIGREFALAHIRAGLG